MRNEGSCVCNRKSDFTARRGKLLMLKKKNNTGMSGSESVWRLNRV